MLVAERVCSCVLQQSFSQGTVCIRTTVYYSTVSVIC